MGAPNQATLPVELLARLEAAAVAIGGPAAWLPPGPELARYHTDWHGESHTIAPVLRPKTTRQVSDLVAACAKIGCPVAVQGGMTGLVGAALPQAGECILTTERITDLEIDPVQATALVGAGVTLEALNTTAAAHGLTFPVDMGSRGSACIGGMIATNAGGNRVLRYGMTRASVLGLEVVLADGTILSNLKPLIKDNTGYDLKQLFIGSEGTLGIVTRACLRLYPIPRARRIALVAVHGFEAVLDLLTCARSALDPFLSAFEVMWRDYVDAVIRVSPELRTVLPGDATHYVLIETSGPAESMLETALSEMLVPWIEIHPGANAILSQSGQQDQQLWALRDLSGEAAKSIAPIAGFDISLPIDQMADWATTVQAELADRGYSKTQTYGHVGDGNLHIVVGLDPDQPDAKHEVDTIVYAALAARNGSISAEHGIGLAKREWLSMSRSAAEISAMQRLKRVFDPGALFNRERLFQQEEKK